MRQLHFQGPGFISQKSYYKALEEHERLKINMVRLKTMNLEEGLAFLEKPIRKIDEFNVENVQKSTRLKMFKSGQITCVSCGLKGVRFHIERHRNDKVMPFFINLYGIIQTDLGEQEILMTWDHILPSSLGGSNKIENSQCMCQKCNSRKGNKMKLIEMVHIVTHPRVTQFYKDPFPIPDDMKSRNLRHTAKLVAHQFEQLGPVGKKKAQQISNPQSAAVAV